jgi:hypothetical protein
MESSDIERIKANLDAVHSWPGLYMFKFIVPSDLDKIAKVKSLFNGETAEIKSMESKNGKFTSITIREIMIDSDSVLELYKKAAEIEGLIAL